MYPAQSHISQAFHWFRHLPKRFIKDDEGVAAVEFSLVAPIMIAFYLGLVEISMAMSASRSVASAASVAADLVTQIETADAAMIADVMTASMAVLGVDPQDVKDNVTVELNSYKVNSSGQRQNIGRARLGSEMKTSFNPEIINDRMLNSTSGIIVARVSYKFKPVTLKFITEDITLEETFVLKPRSVPFIEFSDAGLSKFECTTPEKSIKITCSPSSGDNNNNDDDDDDEPEPGYGEPNYD